jgi:pimeloyl-ACP methyl ester carboxylesterase
MGRLSAAIRLLALALMAAACVAGGPSVGPEAASPPLNTPPSSSASLPASLMPSIDVSTSPAALEGMFEVGDHSLYLRCTGAGTPTIVYLHGYIRDPSGGGSTNAGSIPDLLQSSHQVCVYDRANVGRSGQAAGPLTGASSVTDLHSLLEAAGVDSPYVLLGASYGGLIAYMYAATYPSDVQGMVLLDAVLPDDPAEDDWEATTERLDQITTSQQAMDLVGSEPPIPLTYIAVEDPDLGPITNASAYQAALADLRERQQAFVDGFSPGRLIVVDAPHFMEPAIPERIAEEVKSVVAAGR